MLGFRSRTRIVMALTGFSCMFFVAAGEEVYAQNPPSVRGAQNVEIPPGATVQIDGKTARLMKNGATGGAWECTCGGEGSCEVSQGPSSMYCSDKQGACKGACVFISTTGVSAGESKGIGARAPIGAPRQ
jgi:hypothetical protein